MSRKFLLLALLLAAGCSNDAPPAAQAPQPATPAGDAAVAAVDCPEPGYSPLPPGAVLDQGFLVRQDRVGQTKSGALRRRTSLELLGGDAPAIAAAIVDSYAGAGFRKLEIADRGDGVVRFAVAKGGVGRINISAAAGQPRNPSHPASVGVVGFDWQVAGAPGNGKGGNKDAGSQPAEQEEEAAPPEA